MAAGISILRSTTYSFRLLRTWYFSLDLQGVGTQSAYSPWQNSLHCLQQLSLIPRVIDIHVAANALCVEHKYLKYFQYWPNQILSDCFIPPPRTRNFLIFMQQSARECRNPSLSVFDMLIVLT